MPKIAVNCHYCGKEFKVWEAWIRKGAGKHCSKTCSYKTKENQPSYKRTREHRRQMSIAVKKSSAPILSSKRFTKLNNERKGKTWDQIYGVDKATTLRKRFRVISTGQSNGNWIDGRSFLPYAPEFNKLLKEKIIERDKYTCKGCGVSHSELAEKDIYGRGLTIHHIDYDKNNSSETNLIALCRTCNSRANGRREYHREYYGNQI